MKKNIQSHIKPVILLNHFLSYLKSSIRSMIFFRRVHFQFYKNEANPSVCEWKWHLMRIRRCNHVKDAQNQICKSFIVSYFVFEIFFKESNFDFLRIPAIVKSFRGPTCQVRESKMKQRNVRYGATILFKSWYTTNFHISITLEILGNEYGKVYPSVNVQ